MSQLIFADKYVVQEEIARGGMGVIYKALDRTLNRIVAIKLVHAHLTSDPSFAERFLREARAMARLHHEHIVTIFSVEQDRGTQLLVMEYFPGMNLRSLLRQHTRLPPREAVTIALQLAHALAYAHSHGIVHRDVKPANVLIDQQYKAKLTDFGIAAALDESSITSTGQVIGTPEYMSPEQARGIKLDGRSDLYSFGMVFYEMLTGHTPYRDVPKTSILGKLLTEQQELRLEFPPDVPSYLQSLIRELTHRDPADRLQSADALAAQLTELLYSLPAMSPLPPPPTESESTTLLTAPQARAPQPLTPDLDRTLAQPTVGTARPTSRVSVPDATVLSSASVQRGRAREPGEATGRIEPPREQAPAAPPAPSPAVPSRPLDSRLGPRRLLLALALLAVALGVAVYYFAPALQEPGSPIESDQSRQERTQQLHSLLEQFRLAYEHRDLATLQSLSRMSESRLRSVQLMFGTYRSFEVSFTVLSSEAEESATAVLTLESAVMLNGETVDLPPLAKTIRLTIPRADARWGKIIW